MQWFFMFRLRFNQKNLKLKNISWSEYNLARYCRGARYISDIGRRGGGGGFRYFFCFRCYKIPEALKSFLLKIHICPVDKHTGISYCMTWPGTWANIAIRLKNKDLHSFTFFVTCSALFIFFWPDIFVIKCRVYK